eukprot:11231344-Alexandrium_andersonii.AAC.1
MVREILYGLIQRCLNLWPMPIKGCVPLYAVVQSCGAYGNRLRDLVRRLRTLCATSCKGGPRTH